MSLALGAFESSVGTVFLTKLFCGFSSELFVGQQGCIALCRVPGPAAASWRQTLVRLTGQLHHQRVGQNPRVTIS